MMTLDESCKTTYDEELREGNGERMHEMHLPAQAKTSKNSGGGDRDIRIFMRSEVNAGGIGIRDGRFNNAVDIREIAGNDTRLKEVEATTSESSGTGSVDDIVVRDGYISRSERDINGEREFVGGGKRKDDGLKFDEHGVTERLDKVFDLVQTCYGEGVRVGDGAGELLKHDLKRDDYTGIRPPRG